MSPDPTLDLVPLTDPDLPAWTERARRRLVRQRITGGWRESDARRRADAMLQRAVVDGRLAPEHRVWRVRQDGTNVGDVWVVLARESDAHVIAVDVPEQVARPTFDALAHAVGGLGVTRLVVARFAGDEVTGAFIDGRRSELMATQMELALDDVADQDRVRLELMTADRYARFLEAEIEHYAEEMLAAGSHRALEAARADSRRQHDHLLPDGPETPGQFLWSALDPERQDGQEVGVLWVNVTDDRAFIYDIEVERVHRRQGYGRAILLAGAHESTARGAEVLGLNVFGPNTGARALYEQTGFATIEQDLIVHL